MIDQRKRTKELVLSRAREQAASRALAITGRVRRMVCMEAMARAGSTEAFSDVLATIVRADEVVAMDPEGTLVG